MPPTAGAVLPAAPQGDATAEDFFRALVRNHGDAVKFATIEPGGKTRYYAMPWGPGLKTMRGLQAGNPQTGVYFTLGMSDMSERRTGATMRFARTHSQDADDPERSQQVVELWMSSPFPPHAVVETSPGKLQLHWFIAPDEDFDRWEARQRQMNAYVNSRLGPGAVDESICDRTRIMRVPGSLHCKGGPVTKGRILYLKPGEYSAAEVDAFFATLLPVEVRAKREARAWDKDLYPPKFLEVLERLDVVEEGDGEWTVECPNAAEHSEGTGTTAKLYAPSDANNGEGGFNCFHDHCKQRLGNPQIGGIYRWAQTGSFAKGAAADPGDFDNLGNSRVGDGGDRVGEAGAEAGQRFRIMIAAELAALPPLRWRVKGVLPQQGIGAVYGSPGVGKSFLVLDLLGAVADGRDWFGHWVTPAPVVYVALEGEAGVAQRVQAYSSHRGVSDSMRFLITPLDIRNPQDRDELVAAVKAAGLDGGVLCIDTLAASAPGLDENASPEMGWYIAIIKEIQKALGGLVLLVHHSGKDQTRGLRGHSSLLATLDGAIEVTRKDDRGQWRIAKSKDGEDSGSGTFRLEQVELGMDEDDEPVTSCVVAEMAGTCDGKPSVRLPSGGNQRIAYDALVELLRAPDGVTPLDAPEEVPLGVRAVKLEEAIARTRGRLTCDPKRQTERAQDAFTGLIYRNIVVHRDGWLWLP